MKRLALLVAIILLAQLTSIGPVQAAPEDVAQTKELNFVYLHGAGGNICSFQLLDDSIRQLLPEHIRKFEQTNPGISIQFNAMRRCYPGYVDIETWANNIAESIETYFPDKKNLVLVGHSMGGKSALYAVTHNVGGLADKVAMVVTINSPIKSLNRYYVAGGGPAYQYCRARWLQTDEGVCGSVTYYDSSPDGDWVGRNRHWLAFISGETEPISEQFDISGIDVFPRNMDDSIVPISAQYSDGADVVYYGEHGHSDFSVSEEVAEYMAEQILRYILGGFVECSAFARSGIFKNEAGWLPGRDYWENVVGGIPASSGTILNMNESYTGWQEWEDVVGECPEGAERDRYYLSLTGSLPFLTSIEESYWISPGNAADCRLYLRTRAAPRSQVQVNWSVHQVGLLPVGSKRNRYEVEIVTGTPLTSVTGVTWAHDEPRDLRIQVWSEADRPFRWFKVEWKVFSQEMRQRKVIDEIPGQALSGQDSDG